MSGLNLGTGRANPATVGAEPKNPVTDGEAQPSAETKEESQETATTEEPESEPVLARYTCHPIQRYQVGGFQFENGLLELRAPEEVESFEKILDQLPLAERHRIKTVDVEAAERFVREMLARNGGATQGIDSATGERAINNQVGTGTLGESAGE
jgi:hypothetical protein